MSKTFAKNKFFIIMKKNYVDRITKYRIFCVLSLFLSFTIFANAQAGLSISCVPGFTITCAEDVIVDVDATFVFPGFICNTGPGPVTVSGPVISGPEGCTGATYTFTYSVANDCGEAASCTQVFTLGTQVGPFIISSPPPQTVSCSFNAFPQPNMVEVETVCGLSSEIEVIGPEVFGPAECNGTQIIYTYIGRDQCGRTAQSQQVFTISNVGSEFICPPDICVLDCPADGDMIAAQFASFATQATILNPCGNESTVTNNFSPNNFINANCGGGPIAFENATEYQIVTFTAVDACFGFTNCTALVVVVDNEPPVISGSPQVGVAECGDDAQMQYDAWIQLNLNNLSATDACSNVEWTFTPELLTEMCAPYGFALTEVVFTATDDCGNSTNLEANFTVRNNFPPEFVDLESAIEISCGETANFIEPTISDACGNTTVTFVDSSLPGGCSGESDFIRTYTVTDECGGVNTASQTITVVDTDAPEFTNIPSTASFTFGQTVNFEEPTATDNCSDQVTLTFEEFSDGNDCNGQEIIREWTATDACGNQSTVMTSVVIEGDSEAPIFTSIPSTASFSCGQIVSFEAPIATDNSNDSVTLTFEETTDGNSCANGKEITRVWTAKDACGNQSMITTSVIVEADTEAPVFTFIPETPDVGCNNIPDFVMPIAEDNCNNVTITFIEYQQPPDGVICEDGISRKRDWTATDDCGNSTTVTTAIWINEYETSTTTATVSGRITNDAEEFLDEVYIMAEGSVSASIMGDMITDETGEYIFDLDLGQNYAIIPSRDTDVLNGISTMDLILLGQHLLEVQPLDSPYKIIAADINNSGSISSLDMIALRRLILRVDE